MSEYKLDKVFPIINSAIREINNTTEWADRDLIKNKLLLNKTIRQFIIVPKNSKKDYEWMIGNMVDWFSAHYTKGTKYMHEYQNEFKRKRVEKINAIGKKSKIWAYHALTMNLPEEIDSSEINSRNEGNVTKVYVNRYERSKKAKDECTAFHGFNCKICDFNFENIYSAIGKKYIHVHHLVPISSVGKEYSINPKTDLIPVCPNCHAMLHKENPPLSINELKEIISKQKL